VTLWRLLRDESGATLVEYTMVLGLFALAAITGFGVVATNAGSRYNSGTTTMTSIQENPPPAATP
jgi:Flp pilus assembly pilin Flp